MRNKNNYIIEKGELKIYEGRASVAVIPDGVVRIGKGAFAHRDWLKSVTIPQHVTRLEVAVFV